MNKSTTEIIIIVKITWKTINQNYWLGILQNIIKVCMYIGTKHLKCVVKTNMIILVFTKNLLILLQKIDNNLTFAYKWWFPMTTSPLRISFSNFMLNCSLASFFISSLKVAAASWKKCG